MTNRGVSKIWVGCRDGRITGGIGMASQMMLLWSRLDERLLFLVIVCKRGRSCPPDREHLTLSLYEWFFPLALKLYLRSVSFFILQSFLPPFNFQFSSFSMLSNSNNTIRLQVATIVMLILRGWGRKKSIGYPAASESCQKNLNKSSLRTPNIHLLAKLFQNWMSHWSHVPSPLSETLRQKFV